MIELSERLDEVFALDPRAPAVGFQETWHAYGALKSVADELSAIVAECGLGPGTPVAVLLRNRPAHLAAALGLLWSRHCLVTVNPLLPPAPLASDIRALRAPILVADEQDWANASLAEAARETGALGVSIASRADGLSIRRVAGLERITGADLRPNAPETGIEMLSSGTTGVPKRIKLDARSFAHSLWAGSKYESGAGGPLVLKKGVGIQWMPLAHIGGLFGAVYAVYNARSFVLMEKFDLDAWHDLVVRYRPKFVNLPPSSMGDLMRRNFPKEDFSSLLALRMGAAPVDHDLAVAFEQRYGVPVLEGYGATEFAGGVAGWTIKDHREFAATKRHSVGRAQAGVQLRVVDRDTFDPLAVGEEGLLEVKTAQMDGGRTWVRTTDLARLDAEGFLYILGRADSAIIRGGFKIMPASVEEALRAHPGVKDVCVVGIKDERLGQVPVAAVVLQGEGADADGLKAFLRDRLKPYEAPVDFAFVDALPRTPSLKVSLVAVRDLFAARG